MRKFVISICLLLGLGVTAVAVAGSPHFIKSATKATVDGNTVTVSGKLAGLGNEAQVHVVLSGDAACVNPGGNKPQAANKQSFNAEGDFPVQNGKAEFTLTMTATFQPDCSPPMSVVWSNLKVEATTYGLVLNL